MKGFNKHKAFLSCVIMAGTLGMATTASATTIDNIGGINVPMGMGTFNGGGYETELLGTSASDYIGQTISGFGSINQFTSGSTNVTGSTIPSICATAGCTLSYQFGGFTVTNAVATGTPGVYQLSFTGGFVNLFYQSTTPTTFDYTNSGNGTPWLTLTAGAYDATLNNGTNGSYSLIGSNVYPGGYGSGYLNVSSPYGATANEWFNTNSIETGGGFSPWSIGNFADVSYSSISGLPTGKSPYTLANVVTGSYYAVPEPSDLGMMGLGLLIVGMLGLRMRQSRYRRD